VGGSIGNVTVEYETFDITGVASLDYVQISGIFTFADGQTEVFLEVHVIDDAQLEENETFALQLSNPTNGAVLGSQSKAIVTIEDNDGSGVQCNDVEPNNYMREAKEISLNTTCQGSLQDEPIGREGEDYYKFVLTESAKVLISLTDIPAGANYDLRTGLYEETVLGRSLNSGNADEYLEHQLSAGEYYIGIRQEAAAEPHTYKLSVRTIPLSTTITPTDTPTNTPTNTPTDTSTNTPTNTPTDTPTNTPTNIPRTRSTPRPLLPAPL
jgi:hypothetical protein